MELKILIVKFYLLINADRSWKRNQVITNVSNQYEVALLCSESVEKPDYLTTVWSLFTAPKWSITKWCHHCYVSLQHYWSYHVTKLFISSHGVCQRSTMHQVQIINTSNYLIDSMDHNTSCYKKINQRESRNANFCQHRTSCMKCRVWMIGEVRKTSAIVWSQNNTNYITADGFATREKGWDRWMLLLFYHFSKDQLQIFLIIAKCNYKIHNDEHGLSFFLC